MLPGDRAGRAFSVIHNGIDTEEYQPDHDTDVLERHGVDPATPYVIFVGRITHQKGLEHLLDAAPSIDPSAQLVLCAGAPDTPEIGERVRSRIPQLERDDLDRGDAAEAAR